MESVYRTTPEIFNWFENLKLAYYHFLRDIDISNESTSSMSNISLNQDEKEENKHEKNIHIKTKNQRNVVPEIVIENII